MRGRRSCSFPEGVHLLEGVQREKGEQREESVHPNKLVHLPHQEALSSHCSVRPPQLLLSSLHPPLTPTPLVVTRHSLLA